MRNGALYGEEGSTLELDSLIVNTATLQSKALELLSKKTLACAEKLREAAVEARELDEAFVAWSDRVPEDWKFSILSLTAFSDPARSDQLYDASVFTYKTAEITALWNRYHVVRLLVNSVRKRLLNMLAQGATERSCFDTELVTCQDNVDSLATDLRRSIPVFFNHFVATQAALKAKVACADKDKLSDEAALTPKMAAIIAWPLTVAVSIDAVPMAQKEWFQRRLKTIAKVLGAPMDQYNQSDRDS